MDAKAGPTRSEAHRRKAAKRHNSLQTGVSYEKLLRLDSDSDTMPLSAAKSCCTGVDDHGILDTLFSARVSFHTQLRKTRAQYRMLANSKMAFGGSNRGGDLSLTLARIDSCSATQAQLNWRDLV